VSTYSLGGHHTAKNSGVRTPCTPMDWCLCVWGRSWNNLQTTLFTCFGRRNN